MLFKILKIEFAKCPVVEIEGKTYIKTFDFGEITGKLRINKTALAFITVKQIDGGNTYNVKFIRVLFEERIKSLHAT